MAYEFIITEVHDCAGLVRLNRPQALNALNSGLIREVSDALQTWDADPAIGAVVITGGDRAFAAGADIKEMAGQTAVSMLTGDLIGAWDAIANANKPTIAAVSGVALGGGCELSMMCDMIIASETAQFGQPEINLGVMPGAGGTQRLLRTVGKAITTEMVLNDRRITAHEAYQWGLVNRVYPIESYLDEALKLANEIAARAPIAVRLAKEAINKGYEMTLAEGIAFERRNFYFLFASDDQTEGMDAFVNKRKPEWKGK